jgi:hypothetical protein
LHSLVDSLSRLIVTIIQAKAQLKFRLIDQPKLQNRSQNPCKEADKGRDIGMSEAQNPYKLPLKTELTVFIEKSDEDASYQHRFEDNR